MRGLLAPILRRLVRRDEGEIARRASGFGIRSERGRRLVDDLGQAFLGGFNAMIDLPRREDVAQKGLQVSTHFRPFFFEGAAMGYLPRVWWDRDHSLGNVERHLLEMNPDFLFLYYVGLGFWYGIRHGSRPDRLATLEPHVDPLYYPLCYDGFGFKLAFFDYPAAPSALKRLERVPEPYRPYAYQGFGRALFFVYMDQPEEFTRVQESVPAGRRLDLETGRALATGFTGVDRPTELLQFLAGADGEDQLAARLSGVTWAMTARARNDPDYLRECASRAPAAGADLLLHLPVICNAELQETSDYGSWQDRSRTRALQAYRDRFGT